MHIGPLGLPEIIIIVVIIAVIFGPNLFVKLGKRAKKTLEGAKMGIEEGAKENGKDLKLDEVKPGNVMDKVSELQDKLDEKLTEAEKEEAEKEA